MFKKLSSIIGAAALAALAVAPFHASAAPVQFVVTGEIFLSQTTNVGGLQAGVESSLLSRIPDGTSLSGVYAADLTAPDVAPGDPNLGDYRDFITNGALSVGAFDSTPGSLNCVNAALDCRQEVVNDAVFVPGSGFQDRVGILTGFLDLDGLTAAVVADSGAVSSSQFTDFDDAPIVANLFLGRGDIDLFDNDAAIDPLSGLFTSFSLTVFVPSIFQSDVSDPAARFDFEIRNALLTPIPVPGALPLAASGIVVLGLIARRRRAR